MFNYLSHYAMLDMILAPSDITEEFFYSLAPFMGILIVVVIVLIIVFIKINKKK